MANQFLIKSTMSEMRSISTSEIDDLRQGIYEGVLLLGYYAKGDTPTPIIYYLSDTPESDDDGSVIEVSDIKLEHEFIGDFLDLSYFGGNFLLSNTYCNRFSKILVLNEDVKISTGDNLISIPCPRGITSRDITRNLIIEGMYRFTINSNNKELVFENVNITCDSNNSTSASSIGVNPLIYHNGVNSSLDSLFIHNVNFTAIVPDFTGYERGRGIINLYNVGKVDINNLQINNIDVGIILRNSHNVKINNTVFNNVATGIFGDGIFNSIISNCELRNTIDQCNEWRGKADGLNLNGKDLIYATGTNIKVNNCRSFYPIERLVYLIADDVAIENNYSLNGDGFKAVGSIAGAIKKNITISNNRLDIDENLHLCPINNPVLTQIYRVENVILSNNTIFKIGDFDSSRASIFGLASLSRNSRNVVISDNYADEASRGFIYAILKTESGWANDPIPVVEGLKILNNKLGKSKTASTGAILSTYGTASKIDVSQLKSVEIYNNIISFDSAGNEGTGNANTPFFIYSLVSIDGLKASGNKVMNGYSRYAHGFWNTPGNLIGSFNMDIKEEFLEFRSLNSNLINMRNYDLGNNSKLKFTLHGGQNTTEFKWVDGKLYTVFKKYDNTSQLFNIGTNEAIVDFYQRGIGYSKFSVVLGVFTDIVGTRDPSLFTWGSQNLTFNGDLVSGGFKLSVELLPA